MTNIIVSPDHDRGMEEAIEWIADEPLEVTPHPIRVAKKSSSDVRPPYAVGK